MQWQMISETLDSTQGVLLGLLYAVMYDASSLQELYAHQR
jgi:hypothetical protein